MSRVHFTVHGVAQPQGSSRAFIAGGRAVITSANKNLKAWRDLVAAASQPHAQLFDDAVYVIITFRLPRPKSLPKKIRHNTKRPDIDKLARAILDALTGIFFADDAQVTALHVLKVYAESGPAGIDITVGDLPS